MKYFLSIILVLTLVSVSCSNKKTNQIYQSFSNEEMEKDDTAFYSQTFEEDSIIENEEITDKLIFDSEDYIGWYRELDTNSDSKSKHKNLTINICYKQKVRDYTIRVKCYVDTVDDDNMFLGYTNPNKTKNTIRGKSVLHFISELDTFKVKLNDYTDSRLYNNTTPLKDKMTLLVDYTPFRIRSGKGEFILQTTSPFFFFDIDFDGEEELFINSYDTFIKGHSRFTIYKRSENRFLTEEPYYAISDYTRIDKKNRLLHIPIQNIGEMAVATGYMSYRIKRVMECDSNKYNRSAKNRYHPYRVEIVQKKSIYNIYDVNGDTLFFKETIDKAK